MGLPIGFFIEGLVSFLLTIMIVLCCLLNRRIRLLRSDEQVLRSGIADLNRAFTQAEAAVSALRLTSQEARDTLMERMTQAEDLSALLNSRIREGDLLVKRIAAIARVTSFNSDRDSSYESSGRAANGRRA